jgi:hypothetical protein
MKFSCHTFPPFPDHHHHHHHHILSTGQLKCFENIIKAGGRPDTTNSIGHTSLHTCASSSLSDSIVFQFLSCAYDLIPSDLLKKCIKQADRHGNTFLHLLFTRKFELSSLDLSYVHIITRFLDLDLSLIHLPNGDGKLLIHLSAESGNDFLLRVVVMYRATISNFDAFSCTPLHYAVLSRNIIAIQTLLKMKADLNAIPPNSSSSSSPSPMDLAKQLNDERILSAIQNAATTTTQYPVRMMDPPLLARPHEAFTAESKVELSVAKGEVVIILFEMPSVGWLLAENAEKKKGMVPYEIFDRWWSGEGKESISFAAQKISFDYLLEDRNGIYTSLEQNGEFLFRVWWFGRVGRLWV